MSDGVLRLLELVQRELNAADARAEVGGKPPNDPHLVYHPFSNGWRLVVVFDSPVDNRDAITSQLAAFTKAFSTLDPTLHVERFPQQLASRRLNETLAILAKRQGALQALVIDCNSPVIWGCSDARQCVDDVDQAARVVRFEARAAQHGMDPVALLGAPVAKTQEQFRARELDRNELGVLDAELSWIRAVQRDHDVDWGHYLRTARAIGCLRDTPDIQVVGSLPARLSRHDTGNCCMARSFAQLYWLVLVFESTFSELHAETAMVRWLPTIERLVLDLPPLDPRPSGGKVMRLNPLRSK